MNSGGLILLARDVTRVTHDEEPFLLGKIDAKVPGSYTRCGLGEHLRASAVLQTHHCPQTQSLGVAHTLLCPILGLELFGEAKNHTASHSSWGPCREMQGPTACTTGSHSLFWSRDAGAKGVLEGQLLFSLFLFPSGLSHPPPPSITASVLVVQSCLTPCARTDCSLPGSSVHGILQARILE